MQDNQSNGWGTPRDVTGLFDTFQRVLMQQNEAWLRVMRKATAGGYTPSDWVADMSDMAQKWYAEVKDNLPQAGIPGEAVLPSLQFELDSQAEGADAKPMTLSPPFGASLHATPLRSLDDTPVQAGPRVTIQASAGDARVLVGLAGLRKLEVGRYVSAIEDESGRIRGVVFVKRA